MSMLKAIDYMNREHTLLKKNQNLYCVVCATVQVEGTWESHVTSHFHQEALKRFDFLFDIREEEWHCKLCRCKVSWDDLKQHEKMHYLVPWDKEEGNYNKNIPQRSCEGNVEDSKIEDRSQSNQSMYENGNEHHNRASDSFNSSQRKNKEIRESSVDFNNDCLKNEQFVSQSSDCAPVKVQKNPEVPRNIRYCENIVILGKNSYYCELCCLEMTKLEDVDLHLRTQSHLNSLTNSKKPVTVKQEDQTLNADSNDSENDYITEIDETKVLCVVCDVFLPSTSLNVREHNQGKMHSRSLKKYGCENISRSDDDIFYCRSCFCTLSGRKNMHLHIKGEIHRSAFPVAPKERFSPEMDPKLEEQSYLSRPNLVCLKPETSSNVSSPLRRPNSIKPREVTSSVEKLQRPLCELSFVKPSESTPAKKLSIPTRKPNTIHSHEAIVENEKAYSSSSLRKPNLPDLKAKVVGKQIFYDSESETVDLKKETAECPEHHSELAETYTASLLSVNNSVNNNTIVEDPADTFQKSLDFITVLNEAAVFCEICHCSVSRSPRNISAHVIGKQHNVSMRAYGCNDIEKMQNSTYFCKHCNSTILHLDEIYQHVNSPLHLHLVNTGRKMKNESPKLDVKKQNVQHNGNSISVAAIAQRMTKLADQANGNCGDSIEENDSIALLANDIIHGGGHNYFCNRCYCNVSGIFNIRKHIAGKKHQKK
ncbi:uncharacterized protein [Venturia canescens]|uniref:uncharacterized protein isoform X2 n=1 Tax=Venturia canescens TaxID=32260 RepID=UPI001C9C8AD4|nr:uncharacterized protein LOC122416171 isoform X2 [Venturia canescens]